MIAAVPCCRRNQRSLGMLTTSKASPFADRILIRGVADKYPAPPPSAGLSTLSTLTGIAVFTNPQTIERMTKSKTLYSLEPVNSPLFWLNSSLISHSSIHIPWKDVDHEPPPGL